MLIAQRFAIFAFTLFVLVVIWPGQDGLAFDKRHGGYGSYNFFGISPGGITYGYSDKNFGIVIGPVGGGYGYGYGHGHQSGCRHHHHYRAPYNERIVERHYIERPVVVQPSSTARRPPAPPRTPGQVAAPIISTSPEAAEFAGLAEQAFQSHQYDKALRYVNHALVEDNANGTLHLFASQVQFALGNFENAARELESATELLDREDWGFVVQNYQRFYNNGDYVDQMKRLVAFTKAHEDLSYPRVLRGYHYFYLGHEESARKQLNRALERSPDDRLAQRLLMLTGEKLPAPAPSPEDDDRPVDADPAGTD